jgi:7-cyano-7-deazaguanine reductase
MAKKKAHSPLTILAKKRAKPSKKLEGFPNRAKQRYYEVRLFTEEFTCLCPMTGQPDFASIEIRYVPDTLVLESKSLKLYLWSYRDQGEFHEHVVNKILDDVLKAVDPHWCRITGKFNVRGGIGIIVTAEHVKTPEARDLWDKTRA